MAMTRRDFLRNGVGAFTIGLAAPAFLTELAQAQGAAAAAAGPPDGVGVHGEAEGRPVVETLLAHHLLGVHAPPLHELRGIALEPRERRVLRGHGELEVVNATHVLWSRLPPAQLEKLLPYMTHRLKSKAQLLRHGDRVTVVCAGLRVRTGPDFAGLICMRVQGVMPARQAREVAG
jgi:hypothetical protein